MVVGRGRSPAGVKGKPVWLKPFLSAALCISPAPAHVVMTTGRAAEQELTALNRGMRFMRRPIRRLFATWLV